MKFSLSTRSISLVLWVLLPRGGLTATAKKTVFDVSRSSRITCLTANADGCTLNGDIGYFNRHGDSLLEVSSCWNFDCTAECDASCSCVNLHTQQACPKSGDNSTLRDDDDHQRPPDVFHSDEPHRFQNLQDIRLACTESNKRCVLSGFEGCGFTVPQYNLYNDQSGLFVVDDVTRGDTSLEIRGCNPVLGSADCDAGCTCHDLATNEPCDFIALPPRPLPSVVPTATKVVFTGLQEATFTCSVERARCDEIQGSNTCGGSLTFSLANTMNVQPAAFRVDQVQRGANSVTFSACTAHTPFSMECDAGCTCNDAHTRRPCHCTNSSMPGEEYSIPQQEETMATKLVAPTVAGLLVLGLCVFCLLKFLCGQKGGLKTVEGDLVYQKVLSPCEIEEISLEGGYE